MRKSRIIIEGLQGRVKEAEAQRDEARNAVNEGLAKLHDKADKAAKDLAALTTTTKGHTAALAKHGEDVAGLADAVRNAVKPAPAHEPDAADAGAKTVTPIKPRSSKAAG